MVAGRPAGKRKTAVAGLPEGARNSTRQAKARGFRSTMGNKAAKQEDSDVDMAASLSGEGESSDDSEIEDSDSDKEMDDVTDEPRLSGENASSSTGTQRHVRQGPTNAEVMALNEASMLYKTNLFKLQIDELLSETAMTGDTKATTELDDVLKRVRDELVLIEDTGEMSVEKATNHVRKLGKTVTGAAMDVPFPDPAPVVGLAIKLAVAAPSVINVVGSYPLGMAVRTQSSFNVDVMVQMPSHLFQERDHLNFRYFYKRAFYVAMMRIQLHRSALNEEFDIAFDLLRNDTRLPIVVLRPKKGKKQLGKLECTIRILPSIANEAFSLQRLSPGRNNVRLGYLLDDRAAAGVGDKKDEEQPATPQYNSAILSDVLLLTHMKYLFETREKCPEFGRAAALLRLWLTQRTMIGQQVGAQQQLMGSNRINGFILSMVLAWLVRSVQAQRGTGVKLSGTMGAHQLFKGAIEFLAVHDFEENAIQFGDDADMDAFDDNFGAVFVDPTASMNLLSGVQAWELAELRLEASKTALDLNRSTEDCFDRVFLSAALSNITAKYDHIFRVDVDLFKFLSPRHGSELKATRRLAELEMGHPVVAVQSHIATFLETALERQTPLVAVHPCAIDFGQRTKITRKHVFYIGVIAEVSEARRLVDLGPNPEAQPQEAAEFRMLWGKRAELRRFRDGSIRLATVWGGNSMSFEARALILPRMLAFLMRRHFAVVAHPEILIPEDLLVVDKARPSSALSFGTADDTHTGKLFCMSGRINDFVSTQDLSEFDADQITFEAAITGFDQLQREIKGLEDQLPLRVLALHPVAPGLRYASLAPPKPLAAHQDDAFIEPLHVMVEFAGSSKWPSDITALHKVKAAFLQRLGECYTTSYPGAHVDVGNRFYGYGATDGLFTGGSSLTLGGQADDFDYERDSFVDIRHAENGYCFRLSILCDYEGELLETKAREMRVAGLITQAEALETSHRRWLRTTHWRPKHHRQILDLCQRYHPAASLTIRLLKRWLSRHMLLGQAVGVPEEIAELLAAHVFTDPVGGLTAPASGYSGFVRCLQLLANWRWDEDLCMVDFSAISTSNDEEDMHKKSLVGAMPQGIWSSKGISPDAFVTLQSAFDEAKKQKQIKGELRIVAEDNPDALWWGTVSPVLTRRLRALSVASLQQIVECLATGSDAGLPQVFTTPLSDYDFVIKLDSDVICRKYEQPPSSAFHVVDGNMEVSSDTAVEVFKNLLPTMQAKSQQLPKAKQHVNPFNQRGIIGFDPIQLFIRDLTNVYRDAMLLFNDVYGGQHIAGLWNPTVVQRPAPFVASLHGNVMPLVGEKIGTRPAATYNTKAVVEEIIRLGEGLIDDFVVQK
ncbi:Nrap protein [Coemansia reversa NRRL 1564]|uniref:Nrap protein n=1 Tax=Coemansia reversa (strain ATCC 12441 / NRRL 1564) TaxID=763665 RepID=A0A2G5BKW8_COERN|nr:Nrap protein [Coemansia reversa NRRL 1564]|eukprot:PIA19664.1 Nrap protein [Coemansia reversa NRRL 1564]